MPGRGPTSIRSCLIAVAYGSPGLERFEDIGEVLHRLPRTTLDAPRGSEHDEEFRGRYLTHVSGTLDELEQFDIDVQLQAPQAGQRGVPELRVSTDRNRRGRVANSTSAGSSTDTAP